MLTARADGTPPNKPQPQEPSHRFWMFLGAPSEGPLPCGHKEVGHFKRLSQTRMIFGGGSPSIPTTNGLSSDLRLYRTTIVLLKDFTRQNPPGVTELGVVWLVPSSE